MYCSACSDALQSKLSKEGDKMDFLIKCILDPQEIENACGIQKMRMQMEKQMEEDAILEEGFECITDEE